MDVADWQARLEREFLNDVRLYDALQEIFDSEAEHARQALSEIRGHFVLLHSLQAFVLETLALALQHQGSPALKGRTYHSVFLFEFVLAFRTIRACETTMLNGYAHSGYATLRGLKERVLFLAANGLGVTSFEKLWGIRPNMTQADLEAEKEYIRKRAQQEEGRVLNAVLRKATDLGPHLDALLRWDRQFNFEVHGDKFSGSHLFIEWCRGGGLPVYPKYDAEFEAIYVNRLGDLGWLLLRLLPLLQPAPSAFDVDWAHRWLVLDDSFREYNDALTRIGKPTLTQMAQGAATFANVRFRFKPETGSYQTCLE